MRALLWLIGLFALAAVASLLATHNGGYVLIVSSPYRIQLSLNLMICILVLGFVAAYLLVRLIRRTLRLPGAVGRFRAHRRHEAAQRKLRESLRFFMEGRFAQALKHASESHRKDPGGDGIATLVAARAAHEIRDGERYREWIARAEKHDKLRSARLMTEAELAVDGRRFDEAAQRLDTLRERGERHIAAQRLALKAAQGARQWEETARLARQLRKHKGMSDDAALAIVRQAHVECLRERAGEGEQLATYWNSIPAREMSDHLLLERAVPILVAAGQGALVRKVVEDMLSEYWEPVLARCYADCCVEESALSQGLARAEGWLREHPQDAGLLLSLGRLCMRMKLWGKAQSYLEAALSVDADRDTHLALARLSEALERPSEAQKHYRRAAELAAA
ncbi:MAG: heme biosynthesis protein HemY [Rhodocyclaceae bacterium]|nr:heme biosynthesis protein HemY [Rhodocyclaceae bacterium]